MIIVGNILYLFFSFLIGFLLVGSALNPILFFHFFKKIFINYINDGNLRLQLALIGILVILICIRYFELLIFYRRREKFIFINTDGGKINIALSAIEDMITKMLEGLNKLSNIRPKIIVGKKNIDVLIRTNLNSEIDLVELTHIQHLLEEKLQNILGKEKEIKVQIDIKKIALEKGKKFTIEAEPKIPFRDY